MHEIYAECRAAEKLRGLSIDLRAIKCYEFGQTETNIQTVDTELERRRLRRTKYSLEEASNSTKWQLKQ
jgi:hypothetical protein